ncbi:hypothetical protein [Winogradskyella aurantiaca]|uniref:hypothetical protein n=1 Tax=Winogradskyella aurantiaca TaxID=2219558 RepID=UPI001300B68B|nr:hypothetical protein [Winogradskyella aurantiaca]
MKSLRITLAFLVLVSFTLVNAQKLELPITGKYQVTKRVSTLIDSNTGESSYEMLDTSGTIEINKLFITKIEGMPNSTFDLESEFTSPITYVTQKITPIDEDDFIYSLEWHNKNYPGNSIKIEINKVKNHVFGHYIQSILLAGVANTHTFYFLGKI